MRRAACAVLVLSAACSRDLTLPEPLEQGTVRGRVLYAVPGRMRKEPAAGATVALLNTGVSGTAGDDGRFKLTDVLQTEGQLLFRFTVPGTGGKVRQKLLQLSDYKTLASEGVDVGDVVVAENASLHGRARLIDAPSSRGHAGITVFVPEGPLTTYTGDDGTWALDELPEGTVQLAFFQSGYSPVAFDAVETRGGEDIAVSDVLLSRLTGAERGSIKGELILVPDAPVGDALAGARSVTGVITPGSFTERTFVVPELVPGLYDLSLTRSGYAGVVVQNVLVFPERETDLGAITVTQMPPFDAGVRPPPPDAGPADSGTPDGGAPDSGTPDSGTPDGGTLACAMHVDCPMTQWCDRGFCRPRCTSSLQCNDGRICEPGTGTCVTPCMGGCDGGTVCDTVNDVCRSVCDLSNPCPPGQRCNAASACEAECTIDAHCNPPFTTCGTGGQCRPSGACSTDLHCLRADMCVGGICNARMTPRTADGGFACDGGCACRMDETCSGGVCLLEPPPTLFVAEDGGGGGTSPQSASSDLAGTVRGARYGDVIALRAGDSFTVAQRLRLDAGTTLAGGYRVCGPNRWVRDESSRTRVHANAGDVVQAAGSDIKVRNLSLSNDAGHVSTVCTFNLVAAQGAPRFEASHLDGVFQTTTTCAGGGQGGVVSVNASPGYLVDDVSFDMQALAANIVTGAVFANGGSGAIRRSRYRCASCYWVNAIAVSGAVGPTTISDCSVDPGTPSSGLSNQRLALGITASSSAAPVVIERNVLRFARAGPSTSATAAGIYAFDMSDVTLRDNVVDGYGDIGAFAPVTSGIEVVNSRGRVERNTVYLPSQSSVPVSEWKAFRIQGPLGALDVSYNVVDGGTLTIGGTATIRGLEVADVATGPLDIHHNSIALGTVHSSRGISIENCPTPAQVQLRDNFIHAGSVSSGQCMSRADGVFLSGSTVLAERNVVRNGTAFRTHAMVVAGSSEAELYANHLWSPASAMGGCGQSTSYGLLLIGNVSTWAAYNTIQANNVITGLHLTTGIQCESTSGGTLRFTANAIGGGGAATSEAVGQTGTTNCDVRASWSHNYFWHDRPTPAPASTELGDDLALDGGPGVGPNWWGANASCLDPLASPPTYALAAGSPCLDRGGVTVLRRNGTPVLLDVEGKSRDGGNGTGDLGAWERP